MTNVDLGHLDHALGVAGGVDAEDPRVVVGVVVGGGRVQPVVLQGRVEGAGCMV